jgi:hypothetical protein
MIMLEASSLLSDLYPVCPVPQTSTVSSCAPGCRSLAVPDRGGTDTGIEGPVGPLHTRARRTRHARPSGITLD